MDQVRQLLARRIRTLRKDAGLTQAELGARAEGIKTSEISRFELAHRTPSLETLARLAEGLGVSLPQLVTFDENNRPGRPELARINRLLADQPDEVLRAALTVLETLIAVRRIPESPSADND